jgi:hypothetical protein
VLFTQVLRDMRRFRVDPAAFVARLCGEPRPDLSRELGAVLSASTDEATIAMANFAPKLVHAFGERALQE